MFIGLFCVLCFVCVSGLVVGFGGLTLDLIVWRGWWVVVWVELAGDRRRIFFWLRRFGDFVLVCVCSGWGLG